MNESTGNQIRKREDCWIIFGKLRMAYRLINRDNHWTGGLPSRGVYERIGRKNGGQGSERNEKLCKV